jgi:hypothetical protein
MARNAKSLKRNDEARMGIRISPSKLPRFSSVVEHPKVVFYSLPATKVGFGPKTRALRWTTRMSSRLGSKSEVETNAFPRTRLRNRPRRIPISSGGADRAATRWRPHSRLGSSGTVLLRI